MICKTKTFIDITKEAIEKVTPNSHIIKDKLYFVHENKKYFVDNKNVVLDYSVSEKRIALWLEDTFGGEIYMLPRINKPDGIMTADYLWNGEYWDLKEIIGNSKQVLYHAVNNKKKQSSNFIFDITKSDLTLNDAEVQIKRLQLRDDTNFLSSVIIKDNNDFRALKRM
ncbi:MAG: hypothetical protein NC483_07775 [Ruminococcus sp.]|nr:hypothetical protein [Ruminococcus sp.]